ncbi:MAG TPA: hypothetical protein VFH73_06945 [Polyangia bacterium]|jgi:hypothetical protein|nr:hypothetical protein [Polyangia bacterium]
MNMTMVRCRTAAGLLVIAATAAGCDSSSSAKPDASDGGEPTDSPGPRATTWSGFVYEGKVGPDGGSVPIGGAKVCLLDHPEVACAVTDSLGAYSMTLPLPDGSGLYAVTFAAPGHLGYTTPGGDGFWPSGVGLYLDGWATDLSMAAGFTYPAQGTAFVAVRLLREQGGGLSGATVTLSSAAAKGPVYENVMFMPDPSLPSTSLRGIAWFGNVTPGEFTVTVNSPVAPCTTLDITGLWPAVGPDTVKAEVGADTIAKIDIICR